MIGKTLGARYELIERIGGGGMALVYKARDLLLNRNVAVKVLRPQFTHDDDFVRRFRREAQAAASLSHPNIVSIYDVGQEDDLHYIVMEYVDGPNLNEIIQERAPLQPEEAVRIASQICDALDHAHSNQVIHRDIKPHNILIGKNGRVKVTDFGIARAAAASTITQTGSVVGSVHYFSPEHAKGVTAGEKSDIYSLGIVLYQMLTGRLPFLGESPISVALKHLREPFDRPRKVNPLIPQSLENVVLRAMRKDPKERYPSARAMLQDLETCLAPERLNEPPIEFDSDQDEEMDKTLVMPALRPDMRQSVVYPDDDAEEPEDLWDSEGLEDKPRRRWILPTVLSVFGLAIIGALIWAIMELRQELSPKDVEVPTVINMKLADAIRTLEEAGLNVDETVLEEVRPDLEEGIVIKQSKQDIKVKEGSIITLTVSKKPELPVMANFRGKTWDEAVAALGELGVNPDNIIPREVFDDSQPGTILDQRPREGEAFDPEDAIISFTISKGKETFPMPNLIGKTEAQALAELERYNLKLKDGKVIYEPSYSVPKNEVFKQFPAETGEQVSEGTEVTLWVSSGYPPDAKTVQYNVTVSPTMPGQESTIKIRYSDARGENLEAETRKIREMTTFKVTLVLAPGKDGQIIIYRDDQLILQTPIPYADVPAGTSAGATTAPEGPQGPPGGEAAESGGENPED